MIAAGCDQPSELARAGRSQCPVLRAIALSFHGQEGPIPKRMNHPRSCEADLQRIATPRATLLLPGKDETRRVGQLRVQHRGGLLSLLFEDLING
jgi:hypothetical protein